MCSLYTNIYNVCLRVIIKGSVRPSGLITCITVLEPPCIDSHALFVSISSKLNVKLLHAGKSKSPMMEAFTPWEWANATDEFCFFLKVNCYTLISTPLTIWNLLCLCFPSCPSYFFSAIFTDYVVSATVHPKVPSLSVPNFPALESTQ